MTSIITDQSGGKYTGDFIKNGKWKAEYPNGDKYDGEFKDDKMEGHGVYIYTNGEKYVGVWKDDKKHGHGVYTGAPTRGTSDTYDGQYKDDKKNGNGKFTSKGGNIEEGVWQDNQMNGPGSWQGVFPGDKYQGGFKTGSWDGHGRRDHQDGSFYVGNWKNGQMDGQGIITRTNGNTYSGIFNNGKEPVEGIYIEKDGPSYKFTRFSDDDDVDAEAILEQMAAEVDVDEGEPDMDGPWVFDMPKDHLLEDVCDETDGLAAKLANGTIAVVAREWYDELCDDDDISDAQYEEAMVGTLTDVTYPGDGCYMKGTFTPKA